MATLTRKRKYEKVRWSLSLSFQHRSSLCGCLLCFSPSHRRSCSYHLCFPLFTTTHMSVAWRDSLGMWICNGSVSHDWAEHRSVSHDWAEHSWSVEARVPVDYASVGLAQARPSYCAEFSLLYTCLLNAYRLQSGVL